MTTRLLPDLKDRASAATKTMNATLTPAASAVVSSKRASALVDGYPGVPVGLVSAVHRDPVRLPVQQSGPGSVVRPLLAGWEPVVNVMGRDEQGRLWVRMSGLLIATVSGLVLLAAPMLAVAWAAVLFADSGAVSVTPTPAPVVQQAPVGSSVPSELPLADR